MSPSWAEEYLACVLMGYRKCGSYLPSFAKPTPIRNTHSYFCWCRLGLKAVQCLFMETNKNTFVSLSEMACQNPFHMSRVTFALTVVYFTEFHKPRAEQIFACREITWYLESKDAAELKRWCLVHYPSLISLKPQWSPSSWVLRAQVWASLPHRSGENTSTGYDSSTLSSSQGISHNSDISTQRPVGEYDAHIGCHSLVLFCL